MAQQELNLFDFWLIIRRRRVIVLFAVILVATLTVTVPYFFGPEAIYKSTSRVRYQRSTTGRAICDSHGRSLPGREHPQPESSGPGRQAVCRRAARSVTTQPERIRGGASGLQRARRTGVRDGGGQASAGPISEAGGRGRENTTRETGGSHPARVPQKQFSAARRRAHTCVLG